MKTSFPVPKISRKWTAASARTGYAGNLAELRTFVQAESRKRGSRLSTIIAREGMLRNPEAALTAAVWLLGNYTSSATRYRLLEKHRVELYKFLRSLAEEMASTEVHFLVTRLVEHAPQSSRVCKVVSR